MMTFRLPAWTRTGNFGLTLWRLIILGPTAPWPVEVHEEDHEAQEEAEEPAGLRAVDRWFLIGTLIWLFRYATSRAFRLAEEVDAFRAEMAVTPESEWEWDAEYFAEDLAGRAYFWAAPSKEAALAAIWKALATIPKESACTTDTPTG